MSQARGISGLAAVADAIVNECADALFHRIFDLEEGAEPDADAEKTALLLMVTGLMRRAEAKQVSWHSLQIAAELCVTESKQPRLTDLPQ